MGKVIAEFTMSLDGFIAGPHDDGKNALGLRGGKHLHDWYFNGKRPNAYNDFFKPKGKNRQVVDEMMETTGAFLSGRQMYDLAQGWNGTHPIRGVPIFVLTHHVPKVVPQGKSTITFVTEGVESAVKQAKKAAGGKYVGVGGADTARQVLEAGLLDEIYVHIAPMLLGEGVPLFRNPNMEQIKLEPISSIKGPGMTHLKFRVVK